MLIAILYSLLLIALVQPSVLAADSTGYQIEQLHRSFGLVDIFFDANNLRVDCRTTKVSLFAKAPDWNVKVFNYGTKKQALANFATWCKIGLGTFTSWIEIRNLEGQYGQKVPIVFQGYKAIKLVLNDSREQSDGNKDGISWSMKQKVMPVTMRYAFLDGVKVDSHIAKILQALYWVGWDNRVLLVTQASYQNGTVRYTLNTNSIKAVHFDKDKFNPPAGFQTVPMAKVSNSGLEYFK
jgi:hypothetical protein